jgi:hypothetical protein
MDSTGWDGIHIIAMALVAGASLFSVLGLTKNKDQNKRISKALKVIDMLALNMKKTSNDIDRITEKHDPWFTERCESCMQIINEHECDCTHIEKNSPTPNRREAVAAQKRKNDTTKL